MAYPNSAAPRPSVMSPGVRRVTFTTGSVPVTGLLGEPVRGPSRALVVALHGGGMNAGYFDGQAHPDVSLLTLGPRLGYTVLALDRPGYGPYAQQRPDGLTVTEQVDDIASALEDFSRPGEFTNRHGEGGGVLCWGTPSAASSLSPWPRTGRRAICSAWTSPEWAATSTCHPNGPGCVPGSGRGD